MSEASGAKYIENGDEVTIQLSGYINHFVTIEAGKLQGFSTVHVDLKEVTMINSLGIKKWFEVLNAIDANTSIKYHNIPPSIVTQMSLVIGFLPKQAEVISFFAPYFDRRTKETKLVLLTPDQIVDGKAPVQKNDLGEDLILDAIEEIYFSFLTKKST